MMKRDPDLFEVNLHVSKLHCKVLMMSSPAHRFLPDAAIACTNSPDLIRIRPEPRSITDQLSWCTNRI